MKIKKLKVENFKSLKQTNIEEFDIINMFYGFNNSGKSNIFRFLDLLFKKKTTLKKVEYTDELGENKHRTEVAEKGFWNGEVYEQPFLFTNNKRDNEIKFEVIIEIDNTNFKEQEEIDKEGYLQNDKTELTLIGKIVSKTISESKVIVTEAQLNDKLFYKNEDEVETFFDGVKNEKLNRSVAEDILSLLNDFVLFIDTDRNFTKETVIEDIKEVTSKNFKNWLYELNIDADKNEFFEKAVKFLNDFKFSTEAITKLAANINSFPFSNESNIGFTKFGDEIEVMLKNSTGRFPLKNFGTGIQQFFYIIMKIFRSNAKVVIIEELELNLSPLYQKELLRFLRNLIPVRYSQLFFSSHSPFFTQEDDLVDIVHHVQIDNTAYGGSSVESYTDLKEFKNENPDYSYFTLFYS